MAPQTPLTSAVWNYFSKHGDSVVCNLCLERKQGAPNTSNMRKHLASKKHGLKQFEARGSTAHVEGRPRNFGDGEAAIDNPEPVSNSQPQRSKRPASSPCGGVDGDVRRASEASGSDISSIASSSSRTAPLLIQSNLQSAFSRSNQWDPDGEKSRDLTDAVLYMICKDNLPLCTVEKKGFVHLMKTAVPRYKLPSVRTFKRYLEMKYNALKNVQRVCLDKVEHIALTTDIWTEMMNCRSYLGVTAHYLNNDGQPESVVLGVRKLNDSKTSENLSMHLTAILSDWGIPHEKIVMVVTDLGANIVAAVRDLFGERRHLACFAHGINLVAQKAVPLYSKEYTARDDPVVDEEDELELLNDKEGQELYNINEVLNMTEPKAILVQLIKNIKNIVKFFKRSEVATRALNELQDEIKKLILDVRTRWNSVFDMVERFLELKVVLSTCLLSLPSAPPMVSASQLQDLQEVMKVLQPLKNITVKLCGQKYVTVSMIIPLPFLTDMAYTECEVHGLIGKDVLKRTRELLKTQFSNTESNPLLAAATILDPRFKKAYFKNPLNASKGVKYLVSLLRQYSNERSEQEEVLQETSNRAEPGSLEALHHQLASRYAQNASRQQSANSGVPLELERYLLKLKLESIETDPLQTWKGLRLEYPALYKLVKRILIIPATSVPSERLFSLCGQLMTKLRNRLGAAHLDMLVFLNTVPDFVWLS